MAKKILVVDDEEFLVEMLRIRLEANGYEVITAYDGEAALQKAQTESPDLIILDLMLPKMDGYAVCRQLKADAKYKNIPIMFFTASAQRQDIEKGKELGADDYVTKPFDPKDLLKKVANLLGRTSDTK